MSSRSTRLLIPTLLVFVLALAGCSGANRLTAEANLSYNGDSSGVHQDKASCNADGVLAGSGEIVDGQVTVQVRDGDGAVLLVRTYDGDFSLADTGLEGEGGTWTLSAQRSPNDVLGDGFDGRYDFFLNCKGL